MTALEAALQQEVGLDRPPLCWKSILTATLAGVLAVGAFWYGLRA